MDSMRLFVSMVFACLSACTPNHGLLYLTDPAIRAAVAQEVSSPSALSAELRAMAAAGQLGNKLGAPGDREQIKKLYESAGFTPLWISKDQPTSQAASLIDILRTSRLKGLNPSDYDAE